MSKLHVSELLKTQKSLTEWLDEIHHIDAERMRVEDNEKRERLKVLNEVIALPFDKPTQFEAAELSDSNIEFTTFLKNRGSELCALRLMPKKKGLPKLRMRGKSIRDAYEWYKEQQIVPEDYRADFVPHADESFWATIFIVNNHGIQGEIIYGGHHQLTQGFHDADPPITFRYDFNEWSLSPHNSEAKQYLQDLIQFLYVEDTKVQKILEDRLGATFVNGYLQGYFETTDSKMGTWFIDYSALLGALYADTIVRTTFEPNEALLQGQSGSVGKVKGRVVVVDPEHIDDAAFPQGSVLVCAITTPDYIPLMQKASAIVTDQGGILSHAAIVARELKVPCIVGTGTATTELSDGMLDEVDADNGTVARISLD